MLRGRRKLELVDSVGKLALNFYVKVVCETCIVYRLLLAHTQLLTISLGLRLLTKARVLLLHLWLTKASELGC